MCSDKTMKNQELLPEELCIHTQDFGGGLAAPLVPANIVTFRIDQQLLGMEGSLDYA